MVLSDGIEGRAAQEEVLHRFRALEAQLALQGVRSQGERVSHGCALSRRSPRRARVKILRPLKCGRDR